jgi:adenylylsulfate kinase
MVIWLIGMSGVGKTTIGRELHTRLQERIGPVVFIDGDLIRDVFGNDLGHSIEDRKINASRISHLCRLLDRQGFHVLCMVLSIFPDWQAWNRAQFSSYYQIYIRVPMDILFKRDTKGLYQKATKGIIKNVVGIDIAFPEPYQTDLIIDNDFQEESIKKYTDKIIEKLLSGNER